MLSSFSNPLSSDSNKLGTVAISQGVVSTFTIRAGDRSDTFPARSIDLTDTGYPRMFSSSAVDVRDKVVETALSLAYVVPSITR